MQLNSYVEGRLATALGDLGLAQNMIMVINAAAEAGTFTPAVVVPHLDPTTNLPVVPDLVLLQDVIDFLVTPELFPNVEARLDAIEAKLNAILIALKDAGLMLAIP